MSLLCFQYLGFFILGLGASILWMRFCDWQTARGKRGWGGEGWEKLESRR